MSLNLFAASNQWATRPADERFWSLSEMHAACDAYRESAITSTVPMRSLRCVPSDGGNLALVGNAGHPATFTHWSFGQLSNRVGAPAEYLRQLPPDLAAANINHGLSSVDAEQQARILFHRNGTLVCRSLTSEKYSRIYNADIVARLLPLTQQGWRVPPARPAFRNQPGARPATEADLLNDRNFGLSVKVGDMIAPAGLYASDHDMFAFMVNESARIDDGSEGGLSRGFFVSNSEVGAASLRVTKFLYRHVCSNHIVWCAERVHQLRIIHRGAADRRFARQLVAELRVYAESSAADDEARIVACKRFKIGASKDEVLDRLFAARILPRRDLEAAYNAAESESATTKAGSPRTAWGFAQGVTRMSQDAAYADERNRLDRAAGRVLEMAF